MFTGIIEAKGKAQVIGDTKAACSVRIQKPSAWKLAKGESVAVNGVCSTVVRTTATSFIVDYIPETLRKTTIGSIDGTTVNLERSLRYGARTHGHFVQGHVDAVGQVMNIEKGKQGTLVSVGIPVALRRFVALHGSITLNGVSLTVAKFGKGVATVALIPHTFMKTNLGTLHKGEYVNIEVDMLARYGRGRVPTTYATKPLRKGKTSR